MREWICLIAVSVFSAGLLPGQAQPTGTEYHTVYLSADGTKIYGESSLETSTMNIPPGTTIVHTVTASFSLQAGSGSKTNFSAVQSGGPQQSLDPVELGYIPWGPDVLYTQIISDTAVCNYFGYFFDDSSAVAFTPPPVITGLQDFYSGQYSSFAPETNTPQSANHYLVIYGHDLTAAGLSNPPTVCMNTSTCSAGGAITVSGFHLGPGWSVSDSQINVPYWVDANATAGTYSLLLQTVGGIAQTTFSVTPAPPALSIQVQSGFVSELGNGLVLLGGPGGLTTTAITAVGNPSGGSVTWSAGPKLQINGVYSINASVTGTSPSVQAGDTYVSATYVLSGQSAGASIRFTALNPSEFKASTFPGGLQDTSPYLSGIYAGYQTTISYYLYDQSGSAISLPGITNSETLTTISNPYSALFTPPDNQPKSGGSGNDMTGRMADNLTAYMQGGLPGAFSASRSQHWVVNGFPFTPNQTQQYSSTSATISVPQLARQ